jgi:hypothetical protein
LEKLKEVDGSESILTVIAHEPTWLEVLKFFPEKLNDWKAEGHKPRGAWAFLKDFRQALPEIQNSMTTGA